MILSNESLLQLECKCLQSVTTFEGRDLTFPFLDVCPIRESVVNRSWLLCLVWGLILLVLVLRLLRLMVKAYWRRHLEEVLAPCAQVDSRVFTLIRLVDSQDLIDVNGESLPQIACVFLYAV